MTIDWEFQDDKPFIERSVASSERGPGCLTHIIYDGDPVSVIWYNERKAVQVSGGNGFTQSEGKHVAIFGIALIKIIISGDYIMKEL